MRQTAAGNISDDTIIEEDGCIFKKLWIKTEYIIEW